MRLLKHHLFISIITSLTISIGAVARTPLAIELYHDENNSADPVMGDHLCFRSTITNTGKTPVVGLVAWISLVEVDPGNEQPVDLEDWSAQKAITGTALEQGQTLRTDWPMRLIKGGEYRVVISVTDRSSRQVYTSPTVQFHVRQKQVLQVGRVVPVAAGVPLLLIGLMIFTKKRQHSSGFRSR